MIAFTCKSRTASGEVVHTVVEAASKRDALSSLEREGLFPIRVRATADGTAATGAGALLSAARHAEPRAAGGDSAASRAAGRRPAHSRRVKRRDLMQFSLQLSSSLGAGVPMLASLQAIRRQTRSEAFKGVLAEVIDDVEGGLTLSGAMRAHPGAFPEVYVGTIEAGEKSGTLDEMLDNLAEYLEAELEVASDVRSALLYPAIVLCTLGLAISILVIFIVPRFATFYDGFDAELPLPTRILIAGSSFVSDHSLALAVGVVAVLLGCARLLRLAPVRRFCDRGVLRVPVLGRLIDTSITLRVVQMLGLFTRAGVPVLEGVRTVANTTTNTKYRRNFELVAEGIAVGQTLADGMEASRCFPEAARHMLASGEATGSLERACFAVAKHYKKELRYLTKNMATFIEPLLTLVLAVVVLFIALAAFLPMWDLVQVIGK